MKTNALMQIRERVIAQRSRYGARWNKILRDRAALLDAVDERENMIEQMLMCPNSKPCKVCRDKAKELLA